MKKVVVTLMLLVLLLELRAQGLGDFFNQKAKMKKNMITQILFTKTYRDALNKGYSICKGGWNTVQGFKNGEFNLHDTFFKSLKHVNPVVSKYVKVSEVIAIQIDIMQTYKKSYQQMKVSQLLSDKELAYVTGVYARLLEDCSNGMDDLINVTTDNRLQMTDDERIQHIDQLYDDMVDRLQFTESFSGNAVQLIDSRKREKNDIQWMNNALKK